METGQRVWRFFPGSGAVFRRPGRGFNVLAAPLASGGSCREVAGVAEIPRSRVRRETGRTRMRARVQGRTPGRAGRTAGVRALPVILAVIAVLVMAGGGQAAPRTAMAGVSAEARGSSSGP